jgi:glucarate dehydratase
VKIADLRATPVNIPLRAPYRFAYGSIASLTKTVVEVVTDEGVVGLGEIAGGDCAAAALAVRDRLIGVDILDLNGAEARCVPAARYSPWDDALGHRRVFGGIEMALWDARGRAEGRSLTTLLGGAVRTHVGLTEYFSLRLPGPGEPGESSPLEVARYCARMIAEHDADGFEGKVATVALDEEVAMVREVRAAIGPDRELRLDANGGWTVPTARDALRRLDPYDVRYYEDPVETNEEMAALRPATRASFSSHLTDLRKTVVLGAPDTIVSNVNEFGGIRRAVEFARACERFDVGFRFHSGETGIGSAAYLHLSAAIASVREPSQTLFRWYADDVIAEGPFVPAGGLVEVPTGPGLGVTLDPAALARCHERYRTEGPFPGGPGAGSYGGSFSRR